MRLALVTAAGLLCSGPALAAEDPTATAETSEAAAEPSPDDDGFLNFDLSVGFLGQRHSGEAAFGNFGYGFRGGLRFGDVDLFLSVQHNMWPSGKQSDNTNDHVLNGGLGGAFMYFDQRLRTSLVLGVSVLMADTGIDDAGAVGVFFDLRPIAYRFDVAEDWSLELSPLGLIAMIPQLEGLPIVDLSVNVSLAIEVGL